MNGTKNLIERMNQLLYFIYKTYFKLRKKKYFSIDTFVFFFFLSKFHIIKTFINKNYTLIIIIRYTFIYVYIIIMYIIIK